MDEQSKDGVKEAEEPATPPVAEEPQAPVVSQDVKTEEKDYSVLYENTKKALKEAREKERTEREQRIALEERLSQTPDEPVQDDDGTRRFLAVESLTRLNTIANYDPFVKDNVQELQAEIERNPTQGAEQAITALKARFMDTIITSSDIVKPKTASQPAASQPLPEDKPEKQVLDPNLPDLEARLNERLG